MLQIYKICRSIFLNLTNTNNHPIERGNLVQYLTGSPIRMGSSASIMQATLSAADPAKTTSSTITFHCEELRDKVEAAGAADKGADGCTSSGSESPGKYGHGVTSRSPDKYGVMTSPEQAAVTRYFPLIQPNSSFLPGTLEGLEGRAGGVLSPTGYLDSKHDNPKQAKENYYYSCDVCCKGFMFKGSLNRHLARHVQQSEAASLPEVVPAGEDLHKTPRQLLLPGKMGSGTSEVRYQLKDPRLYEQQCKSQQTKLSKVTSVTSATTPGYTGPRKARSAEKCALCGTSGHSSASCKTFPRSIVLGQKVLAICSCLKCNKSFDDVDKLKDHISRCQGFVSNSRPKQLVQSECNVR